MPRFQGVVFDLDDTLYLERDYVRSGFRYVAGEVARVCDLPEEAAFSFLWNQFTGGLRGNNFDRLLEQNESLPAGCDATKLIDLYRSHSPKIEVATPIRNLLESLRTKGCLIGIISDGAYVSQQAKVAALGLNSLVDQIILTDAWGRTFWKPHSRSFTTLMDAWQLRPADMVYVADNPHKDFVMPRQMGWTTVRVRIEGQIHFEIEPESELLAPEVEIRSYDKLSEFLLLNTNGTSN